MLLRRDIGGSKENEENEDNHFWNDLAYLDVEYLLVRPWFWDLTKRIAYDS